MTCSKLSVLKYKMHVHESELYYETMITRIQKIYKNTRWRISTRDLKRTVKRRVYK